MSTDNEKPSSWALVSVIVIIVIAIFLFWQFFLSVPEKDNTSEVPVIEKVSVEEDITLQSNELSLDELAPTEVNLEPDVTPIVNEEILPAVEDAAPEVYIPALNESDSWIQEKLTSTIWRKELLKLLINEDMVRRFVVFVDNFSRGDIAYSHSPFINPSAKFLVKEASDNSTETETWLLDESSFKRFSLYVDLFRSVDADTLVVWYQDIQPLITEAYDELGYPDKEFNDTLQLAITKVLDLEFPKDNTQLIRPSVMYRYQNSDIEALDDADKLMLRIGKENLLIIKSVLLEINEKLYKSS